MFETLTLFGSKQTFHTTLPTKALKTDLILPLKELAEQTFFSTHARVKFLRTKLRMINIALY